MVTLGEGGVVAKAAPIDPTVLSTSSSTTDVRKIEDTIESAKSSFPVENGEPDTSKPANKLVKDEEKAEGRISRRALISFFSNFGGPVYWIIFFALIIGGQGITAFQTYWLGLWSRAYEHAQHPQDVSPIYWLGLYIVWVIIGLAAISASATIYYLGAMRASRIIHAKLVDYIFGGQICFLALLTISLYAFPRHYSSGTYHRSLHEGRQAD